MIKNDLKLTQDQVEKVILNLESEITKVEAELATVMYQQSLNLGSHVDTFYFDRCFVIRKNQTILIFIKDLKDRILREGEEVASIRPSAKEVNCDIMSTYLNERVEYEFIKMSNPSSGLFGFQTLELEKAITLEKANCFRRILSI